MESKMTNTKSIQSGLIAALGLTALSAIAHHGWSSFDETKPVYIEGTVAAVKWQNPHAELVVDVAANVTLPKELGSRPFPKQVSATVTPEVVARAAVPASPAGKWNVELAPLTRMEAWGLTAPLKVGDRVSMIGFTLPKGGEKLMRVEILYTPDGKAYGLRSAPAK
jgi:hypothetical protein